MPRCLLTLSAHASLFVLVLSATGCLSPSNSDRTTFAAEPLERSRAELPIHDPFPRGDLAPGESLRPRDFEYARDTPRKIREKTLGAQLRQQYGRPTNIVP